MKQFIAAYNDEGITLANQREESALRTEIMSALASLVHQRRHWLMEKFRHKAWVHTTFMHLDGFCRDYKTRSLGEVAAKVLQLEPQFTLILPNPNGKHSCRNTTFHFIIAICKAYLNARSKTVPGKC